MSSIGVESVRDTILKTCDEYDLDLRFTTGTKSRPTANSWCSSKISLRHARKRECDFEDPARNNSSTSLQNPG